MIDSLSESPPSQSIFFESSLGSIQIQTNCRPSFFNELKMEKGLGRFATYSSIIQTIDTFRSAAEDYGGKVTIAVFNSCFIVGYNVCWFPNENERWAALGNLMYEMAAVEVSRNFRGLKLAKRIVTATLDDDFFDDKITYLNGYSWHWDLEGTNLSAADYRSMLVRLYAPFGFKEVYTNEPNIALRPENIMMARMGDHVSAAEQKQFRYLRFGISLSADEMA